MTKFIPIFLLSCLFILSGCQTKETLSNPSGEATDKHSNQLEIVEPSIKVLEVQDFIRTVVSAEILDDEVLESTDFITPVKSIEDFKNYNVDIMKIPSTEELSISQETFETDKVWYMRVYSNEEKSPIYKLLRVEQLENGHGTLVLETVGTYEALLNGDNTYCYSEYIFVTDLDVVELEIQHTNAQ